VEEEEDGSLHFSEMRVYFVGRGGERLHYGNVRWFVGDWCGGRVGWLVVASGVLSVLFVTVDLRTL
jgi:hypothetical protein